MEERVEQPENQETTPANEISEEVEEVEGDSGGVEIFLIDKGAEIFKKTLAKKGFIGERVSKSWCSPSRKRLREKDGRCSANTWSQAEELSSKSSL